MSGPSVALLCVVAFLAAWARHQQLIGICLAIAIVLSGRMPRLRVPEVLALALGFWAYATLWWTDSFDITLSSAYRYAGACLLFVAARHLCTTRRNMLLVGYSYLAACVLRAFQVILESLAEGAPTRSEAFDLSVRFGITETNINFTAYSFVTAAVLSVLLLSVPGQPRVARFGLYAVLPVLAYAVLLTGTKGALIALALGAGYLVLSRLSARVMWILAAVIVPVLLVLVPLGLGSDRLIWLDVSFGDRSTGDMSGRLVIWPYAASSWWDAFLLGQGAGTFPVTNPLGVGAHTLLLTVGNDLGLFGLLLFAAVFAAALRRPASRSTPQGRRLAGFLLTSLLPIWLTGHWETALGVWLTLGLLSVWPAASTGSPRTPAGIGAAPGRAGAARPLTGPARGAWRR
ncbi:hypothetical protein GCM10022225_18040 [Plantactinospora mayteni]|uniref:O-antigen ligase-related domain-containing protein n=1 Tax=Plantactinospora mayteni TaxID=566021 RepID=A0ABQ4EGP4_9ACTN|nr:O-antigen ligase family protein [Plantactinospora mayteni]GIG93877.1 hypothetical protein Pma05_04500 [Plantactinospora mayteni]